MSCQQLDNYRRLSLRKQQTQIRVGLNIPWIFHGQQLGILKTNYQASVNDKDPLQS